MPPVSCCDTAQTPFGQSDHRRVGKTEWQVGVSSHKVLNPGHVCLVPNELKTAALTVVQKRGHRVRADASLNEPRKLTENGNGYSDRQRFY